MPVRALTSKPVVLAVAVAAVVGLGLAAAPPAGAAATTPAGDPFYGYTASTPLAGIAPGTVLASRTLTYDVGGFFPVTAVQLLYRSTDVLGNPTTNVTSVLKPPVQVGPVRSVVYDSYYDSANPADEPSLAIAGEGSGSSSIGGEAMFYGPMLAEGITVDIPDTEGQQADVGAGPLYGLNTLDAIRAADSSPLTGLSTTTKTGLFGYSGGAFGTEWAAQLAPDYAPDVDAQLVGVAEGGVPVDAAHMMRYISGSQTYSGIIPIVLNGVARAYDIDLAPYLSPYGQQVVTATRHASLGQTSGKYPGLTLAQLFKPQYANPDSIPAYVRTVNQIDLGLVPPATVPLFVAEGADGALEGTRPGPPGIGPGDGATVTGDVRTLARQACAAGTPVDYVELDALSHVTTGVPWAPTAVAWLDARLAGLPAPSDCALIPAGNSLAAEQPVPPASS